MLHEVTVAETKGSGIRAMRELMQQHDLLPPTFESSRRPDQFVATFLFHHFLGPDGLAWLRGLTAEALSDEEARALVFVREAGAIDNAAYRNINRADTLNASAHLRRLRDLALLEMSWAGNRTYYVAGPAFEREAASLRRPGGLASDASWGESEKHTSPDANTHQVPGDAPRVPTERNPDALPDTLRQRLKAAGTQPRREAFRTLVVDLCRWQPLSARELATLLRRRDHKHLVRELLSPMVAQGLLAYTIPEMEWHPDQRYVASEPAGSDAPARGADMRGPIRRTPRRDHPSARRPNRPTDAQFSSAPERTQRPHAPA